MTFRWCRFPKFFSVTLVTIFCFFQFSEAQLAFDKPLRSQCDAELSARWTTLARIKAEVGSLEFLKGQFVEIQGTSIVLRGPDGELEFVAVTAFGRITQISSNHIAVHVTQANGEPKKVIFRTTARGWRSIRIRRLAEN